jgi:putative metalloprotease
MPNSHLRKAALAISLLGVFSLQCSAQSLLGGLGNLGAVADVAKAATLSEKDVVDGSRQMMAQQDTSQKVAPAGDKYAKRLAALTSKLTSEDGLSLNFKAYLSPEVNAFATPDGSVRVYSGLMDVMTDDELRGVIGHEIGHTKLGHSVGAMKKALLVSAGRKGAVASGNTAVTVIASSELGAIAESVLNAQFSQSDETAADDYGFNFMKKHKYNVSAMESAFRKLAKLDAGSHSMMSTHPDSAGRAERMKTKAEAK